MPAKQKIMRSASVSVARGAAIAAVTSVLLVLVFAILVLLFDWGNAVITPVNQVIKVLSILTGTLAAASGMRGWKAGMCVGAVYMLLGIILYSAFAGKLLPWAVIAGDMVLGCAAGLLSGMLAGTMKRG